MVIDDIIIAKVSAIEKCIARVQAEYGGARDSLNNLTKLESITLNLQRACEASIDLAMHIVKRFSLGVPERSRDAFGLMEKNGLLSGELSQRMQRMVGFRNIAVHQYEELDAAVVVSIVEKHLIDFSDFGAAVKRAVK